jgi:flagellar protein FliS
MFGARPNAAKAYSTVGIETSVQSASPHQLIILLFEGAREAVIIARAGIESGNIPQKGMAITKAIDIILNGLRASLNLEEGGNLAQNLYALYDYMARRLLHANMRNDKAALDEVLNLLSEIHSAWVTIGDKAASGEPHNSANNPK